MKRMKDRLLRLFVVAVLLAVSIVALKNFEYDGEHALYETKESVVFLRKVDGDTAKFILSDGKDVTCRFLAIDTPETVKPGTEPQPLGKEASDYTEMRLSEGENIILEYDPVSDRYDKYGRLLAWIWIDGSLLQEELVTNGYAKVEYIYGNYKYLDILENAEDKAKELRLGIWGI